MTIPDAPWIGMCNDDYREKIFGKGEYLGTCTDCGRALYEVDACENYDGDLLCDDCYTIRILEIDDMED